MSKSNTDKIAPAAAAGDFFNALYQTVQQQQIEIQRLAKTVAELGKDRMPGYWTYQQTASHYNVSLGTVKNWVAAKIVKAYYPGGSKTPRIKVADLEAAEKAEFDIPGVRRRPKALRK